MKPFTGFSTDRHKTVRVPEGFFEDLLSQITSMLEMKVTLYLFWRLAKAGRQTSAPAPVSPNGTGTNLNSTNGSGASVAVAGVSAVPRMVSLMDLEADAGLRAALSPNRGPRPSDEALREGLELAVARGTVLQVWVREEPNDISEGRAEQWYLLNTRDNRTWIDALAKGEVDVTQTPLIGNGPLHASDPRARGHNSIRVVAERPSVYALYEQNIGLLTPILAERLQDAEGRYPMEWIEEAFKESVVNNKRNWRYIERILERWAAEGKDSGKDRQGAGRDARNGRGLDPDKYTKGKYAFLFRPER